MTFRLRSISIKKIIKDTIVNKCMTDSKDIVQSIVKSGCKIVSFDVYDTLIKRNVLEPKDVFDILERSYNYTFGKQVDIAAIRMEAEKIANQKKSREDVNIYDIYACIKALSDEENKWTLKKELEIEKEVSQKNISIFPIYQWCVKNGIEMYAISDMYLPQDFVEEVLRSNGYKKIKKVYISSEVSLRKSTGNLFKYFSAKEGIEYNDFIHIGDALKGDFIEPRKLGVNAILINGAPINNQYAYLKVKQPLEGRILNAFINNNVQTTNAYDDIGYSILGPLLLGFTFWLKREIEENKVEKTFFLAREGKLLEKAFNILYGNIISEDYIYVSRRATALPRLKNVNSLDGVIDILSLPRSGNTVGNILKMLDIDSQILKDIKVSKNDLCKKNYSTLDANQKDNIYNCVCNKIIQSSVKQEKYIKEYLLEKGFSGNIAVVDVGWHGTIQQSLEEIFSEVKVTGFYIGTKKKKNSDMPMTTKSFLFNDQENERVMREVTFSVDLFELLFLSTEGTTLCYKKDEKVEPVMADNEQDSVNLKKVTAIQDAALKFLDDIKPYVHFLEHCEEKMIYYKNYSRFVNPPRLNNIEVIDDFTFIDASRTRKIVSDKSLGYYLLHINEFKDDFILTGCKLFFMKRVFRLNLPYFKILCFLKRFDK